MMPEMENMKALADQFYPDAASWIQLQKYRENWKDTVHALQEHKDKFKQAPAHILTRQNGVRSKLLKNEHEAYKKWNDYALKINPMPK